VLRDKPVCKELRGAMHAPLSRDLVSSRRSFCLSVCGTLYTFGGSGPLLSKLGTLSHRTFKNTPSLSIAARNRKPNAWRSSVKAIG
jgi:hypothetical protein